VNRKSGEVVIEGVSIGNMYVLKQSIPNILYKNIIEDIEQKKVFMANGGSEFINKNLDKFLKGKGVKQTVSTPHTSKHNRVTGRMLRSIISIARCLLIHSGLSQQFWCEAVWYACFVHSCALTNAVDGVMSIKC
jgi:hypothetical protein